MIDGLIFGTIIFASALFSWMHFPNWIKRFTINHYVLTDLCFMALTYLTITSISKSIIAVVAAITAGLWLNLSVIIYRKIN